MQDLTTVNVDTVTVAQMSCFVLFVENYFNKDEKFSKFI